MQDYRKKVREAALARNGSPLYNGSLEHAAVLTEAMFEHGNKCVQIYTGNLNAHVYGKAEVLEKVHLFLSDRDHKVRVLLERPGSIDADDHPFIKAFRSNDDVEFKFVPEQLAESTPYHFTVMDDDSYRFEENKDEPSAIAAFGDRRGGENLSGIFESLWKASEIYNFPVPSH